MEFCADCGSRLRPIKANSGKQAMMMLTCTKCGHKKQEPISPASNGKTIAHSPKQLVAIIDKEQELTVMPTIHMQCPRCANTTANVWQVQTRGSDESSTQFIRCINCGYTFREYT